MDLFVAGVDVGSVATKAVVLRGTKVVARAMAPTGASPKITAAEVVEAAAAQAGLRRSDLRRTVATGYGRRLAGLADATLTEITAAARGARFASEIRTGTLIDLGGQDTKVIALDESGRVSTFVMNDKCAAGTGKFLEVMAHALGVTIDGLAGLASRARKPVAVGATCTVFAESEVISLIHRGIPREEIAAGLHAAIAGRIAVMVEQVGKRKPVLFMGGGARNEAMRMELENTLNTRVIVPPEPQFVIAAGAAFTAARQLEQTGSR